MCEILEALCSVLPRKVPGSCENCVDNQQGVMSSGTTVSYALCEEEEGKRGANPQCRNFSNLQLNTCQSWMQKYLFCLKFTENVPQKQLYRSLPYIQNKDDNFVFCLLIALKEMHKCWQDETEYDVLNVQ